MPVSKVSNFVDLPGITPARVNANIVSCVRVETGEQGSYVIIHTDQGFAFAVTPTIDLSVHDFYKEVLAAIFWPEKTSPALKK